MGRQTSAKPSAKTSALLIGAGLLAALLVLLGVLQVRWLDQVAQTITTQKRAALLRQGTAFATELERELSRVFLWFDPGPADRGIDSHPVALLTARWKSWRQAGRHTGLVQELWLHERARDELPGHLLRLDPATDTWDDLAWSVRTEGLRRELESDFPLVGLVAGEGEPMLMAVPRMGRGGPPQPPEYTVLVRLNVEYLTGTLLPALADEHLTGASGGDDGPIYAMLADAAGAPLYTWPRPGVVIRAGEHDPILVRAARRDLVTSPLLAGLSPSSHRRDEAGGVGFAPGPRRGRREGPGRFAPLQPGGPGGPGGPRASWTVSLGYAAGPVDAVVTGVRRRNIALGLGLLALLGGAIGALIVAVRRAQALADRQRQFMASVSHELRTPLAVIGAAAENLRDGTVEETARVREYGDMIHAESRRLHAMVDDVLRLAAGQDLKDELHLELIDVRDVVDAAVDSFTPDVRARGGRVDRSDSPETPLVAADPEALRQAVENVLGNALKYGGPAPAVAVKVARVEGPSGAEVQIAIEDHGIGIPADELALVFEPFFRGKEVMNRQIRGTGLGLALVARVMKAHGGGVTVDSTPGQGSRFVLRLPCPGPSAAREARS